MHHGVRGFVITTLLWSAVGGGLAHAQTIIYDDNNESPSLTVDGKAVKPNNDGSFTFAKRFNTSDFITVPTPLAPDKVVLGEVVFTEAAGGTSDIFQYQVAPVKTDPTKVDLSFQFASDDEGTFVTPLKNANFVGEPGGFVQLGKVDPKTKVNYEFFDKRGNAVPLPNNLPKTAPPLIIQVRSDTDVPEPASTASLGVMAGLLALVGANRIRRRNG
jgi:hypothetical protein